MQYVQQQAAGVSGQLPVPMSAWYGAPSAPARQGCMAVYSQQVPNTQYPIRSSAAAILRPNAPLPCATAPPQPTADLAPKVPYAAWLDQSGAAATSWQQPQQRQAAFFSSELWTVPQQTDLGGGVEETPSWLTSDWMSNVYEGLVAASPGPEPASFMPQIPSGMGTADFIYPSAFNGCLPGEADAASPRCSSEEAEETCQVPDMSACTDSSSLRRNVSLGAVPAMSGRYLTASLTSCASADSCGAPLGEAVSRKLNKSGSLGMPRIPSPGTSRPPSDTELRRTIAELQSQAAHCKTTSSAADASTRAECLERYREKKRNRLFANTIRYMKRKINADKRPRIKGRFVKTDELEAYMAQQAASKK